MNVGIVGGILVLALIAVALFWLSRRKGWTLSGRRYASGRFLPSSAPPAGRTARIVDATVLGAAAAFVIATAATSKSNGGLMLILDELRPQYAAANVIMFICAIVGAALAVLITLFGRAVTGAIAAAVVLIGYGYVLNGGDYPGSWFLPRRMAEPVVEYTINIGGTNVEGAELWVNGVYLGKTPYTTTLAEFEAEVPYWPQPPSDYDTDKLEIPQHSYLRTWSRDSRRWIKFELPNRPSRPRPRPREEPRQERKTYYARVRYAGEWGVAKGGSGSGGGGGRLTYRAHSHVDVMFPQRQKRLDTLLDKARLADYRVGSEWFEVIETYDEDGWIALREAADTEPRMMDVLDAWATWRYGLDTVNDAPTAWRVFEQICREAEEQGQYLTPSVAGRAVELLVPQLPQKQLLDRAVKLIRNASWFSYFAWQMNGRLQFGYSRRPGGVWLGGAGTGGSAFSGGRGGARQFPINGYPVAHAVWMLYETHPAVVQERIVPEIVRSQWKAGLIGPMLAAAYFGGPAIDQFLLRQNWRAESSQLEMGDRLSVRGTRACKWLFLLAYLNDDAGREFRREHARAVMNLADKFYEDPIVGWKTHMDFIFIDPWLAKEYWWRFSRLVRRESPDEALKTQWRYLLRMGETATASMFVEAWQETVIEWTDFFSAVSLLDELEPSTQAEVVKQLVQQVRDHPENLARVLGSPDSPNQTEQVISVLESHTHGSARQAKAERLYRDLQQAGPVEMERLRKNVPLWLAHTQPDHPLVEMLAGSEDPDLRLMVMGALREHPTPEHRRLLEQLLEDPVPAVRTAAMDVEAHLKALAAESPSHYASNVPSSTTMPATTSNW